MNAKRKVAIALLSAALVLFYGALLYASCLALSAVLVVLAGIVLQAVGPLPDVSIAAVWLQSAVPVWAVAVMLVIRRLVIKRRKEQAPLPGTENPSGEPKK